MNKLNNNEVLQMTTVMPTMKKSLLALAVAGTMAMSGGAYAAAAMTSTTSTNATNLDGTTLTITTSAADTFGFYDTDAAAATIKFAAATISEDSTLYISDADLVATTAQNEIGTIGATTITASKTFAVVLGATDGGVSTADGGGVNFLSTITGASASMTVSGASAGVVAGAPNTIDFNGAVTLNALTIAGGAGSVAIVGSAVTVTDIGVDSAITTLIINGGTGSGAHADGLGGAVILGAVVGDISGTTYTISGGTGGTGAAGADGGLMTITAHTGAISSTTLNLLAGNAGDGSTLAGGDGGALTITDIGGAITSTTINIKSGNGGDGLLNVADADGGVGGSITDGTAVISSIIGTSATPVTLNIMGGNAGVAGAGTATAGGAAGAAGEIGGISFDAGAIFATTTVQGGTGSDAGESGDAIGGAGAAGGLVVVDDFALLVTGDVFVTGGAGGAGGDGAVTIDGAAGAVGGLATVSDFTLGMKGDLTVLGGAGAQGGAGGTTGNGAAGGDGGNALISSVGATYTGSAATGGAVSVTAGAGGNAGAAGSTSGNAAAGGDGGNATVNFDDSITDISTLTILSGKGGNGSAGSAGTGTLAVGGVAGVAAVTIDADSEIETITLTAGESGAGGASSLIIGGAGTIGGDATLALNGANTANDGTSATTITVTGGKGGAGGDASATVAGVAGTDGGAATLTITTTATAANVTLTNGAAGSAGDDTSEFSGGAASSGGVATLALAGSQTFTGNILTTGNGTGVLTTNGVTTIDGNVGSSTSLDLASLTTVADLHVNGNLYVAAITLGDELTLTGTTDQVVSGTITKGGSDDHLIVSAEARTLTFNGAVSVANLTLGDGTTSTFDSTVGAAIATLDGNSTFTGAVTLSDDAAMAAGTTTTFSSTFSGVDIIGTTTANMTFNGAVTSTGNIATGLGATTTFDSTVSAVNAVLNGSTTIKAPITLSGTFTNGTDSTITLGPVFKDGSSAAITGIDSTGTLSQLANTVTVNVSNQFTTGSFILFQNASTALDGTDAAAFNVTDTAIVDYSTGLSTATTGVKITATKRTTAGIATHLGMSTAQAAALGQISAAVASGDTEASTAMDTVLVAGGSTAVNAAEQLNPDAGAAMGAAMAVTSGVNNVIAGRQANTKIAFNTLGKQSGVSTGDAANDAVVWAQVFTSDATQDKVGTIDGYEADNQGFVVGWEATGKSGSTLGLSLSYSDTDVDGKTASASHTDTTATQASLYGNNGSTDWMMGYALADNDTKRTISLGGLTRTATGNYDSDIFMAKAGYSFDSSETAGFTITPKTDLSWTHIANDGYTETGATNLNLVVGSSSNDVVTARAGAEFAQRIENNGSVTIPRVSVMAGYDLVNDRAETTSTFTGGGSAFTTQGIDPEKTSVTLGFGVDHISDDSTASFDFNADIKDGYSNNTASLTLKSKF